MLYVSDLVGKPVIDVDGGRVGRVQDVVVSTHSHLPHPQLTALAVKQDNQQPLLVSVTDVSALIGPAVVLARAVSSLVACEPGECIWLVRDVLDKEIIDTDDARVVRVNDLQLLRVNGQFYLANVMVGGLAILRRLGLAGLASRLAALVGSKAQPNTVSWQHVEMLPADQAVRLRFSGGKIAELPAADLAQILSELGRADGAAVVQSLNVERLADTLEEVEPDLQASLVQLLPDEQVADVLEEMAPDEAADLLAELPQERSEDLLELMEHDEADDVRKLLAYPENSAGGLMTTDVVAVRPHLTAEQAIAVLRDTAREAETIYYVYVTDEHNHLLGVFSLQALVLAKPDAPISTIMHDRIVTFKATDTQDDVAQAVAKYNLLAVPVVDDENRLLGIVTADDAIDKIVPSAWKNRLPRLYS